MAPPAPGLPLEQAPAATVRAQHLIDDLGEGMAYGGCKQEIEYKIE